MWDKSSLKARWEPNGQNLLCLLFLKWSCYFSNPTLTSSLVGLSSLCLSIGPIPHETCLALGHVNYLLTEVVVLPTLTSLSTPCYHPTTIKAGWEGVSVVSYLPLWLTGNLCSTEGGIWIAHVCLAHINLFWQDDTTQNNYPPQC